MFYDALSRNTVKITLSESDMRRYSLKKDIISGRTDENKRSLTKFLKKFQSESAMLRGMSADRLFLEAFPSDEGGCVLYVSTLCESEKTERITSPPPAKKHIRLLCGELSFPDAANLCRTLRLTRGELDSRLLLSESGYTVIISCPEQDSEKLARVMSEYGTVSASEEEISSADEHGELIINENAVRVMSELA